MYLGSPLLPSTISSQKATQSVKEAFAKKNWELAEVTKESLILVPYFLYNYHYYTEQHKEGTPIIKEAFDGVLAIDGHTIRIEEDKVDLIKYNWNKAGQVTPKEAFEEKWNNIDKKDQNEIIKLKTAEYFDVPKSNVIITAVRKVLVPFYTFNVVCDTPAGASEEEYKIKMNTVDGTMYGLKEVPAREKSAIEITRETLRELKKPSTWVQYTKEMAGGAMSASKKVVTQTTQNTVTKTTTQKSTFSFTAMLSDPAVLVIIMLLALLLIYFGLFVK